MNNEELRLLMTCPNNMKEVYKVFIPHNTPSSKNGRTWTGSHLIASKSTQKWRRLTKGYWTGHKQEFLDSLQELQKPYDIQFTFVRGSRHKFDYVNPLQTVLDEMVTFEWLEDDNADEVKPYFGDYSYNKENPGVWITVLKNLEHDL